MHSHELTLFLHLAKSLHFGKTSSASYISPASLTRAIQKLERELGSVLFERDNRTVRLTPAGELFLDYAKETLDNLELIKSQLRTQASSLRGRLSVFCSVTASYHYLKGLLDRYRRLYPEVEIHLHTGDSALAIERIHGGQEEIGIAARPDRLPGNMLFQSLGQSPLVFIAPAASCPLQAQLGHYQGQPELIPWAEIPMILSETGLSRGRLDGWFKGRNIQPNIYAQVGGNEAIVSMVSLGFGVGVVPLLVVENSPTSASVAVLPVEPQLQPFDIGICLLRRKLANPMIKAFWELSGVGTAAE